MISIKATTAGLHGRSVVVNEGIVSAHPHVCLPDGLLDLRLQLGENALRLLSCVR